MILHSVERAIVSLSPCRVRLFSCIAIALRSLLASVGLHSAEPAIVRLSSCWVLSIQLYCYRPALSIGYRWSALCRACYRPSIVLQELSIQLYCYRPAGSLLASVGLHSAEPAIVRLSPCRSCLFSGIAIDMLAFYWLALVLHSVEPAIVRLSSCWELSIQRYCYRYASSLYPCRSYLFRCIAIVGLSSCRSYLFGCIAIDMLALYFPASDIALCRAC